MSDLRVHFRGLRSTWDERDSRSWELAAILTMKVHLAEMEQLIKASDLVNNIIEIEKRNERIMPPLTPPPPALPERLRALATDQSEAHEARSLLLEAANYIEGSRRLLPPTSRQSTR